MTVAFVASRRFSPALPWFVLLVLLAGVLAAGAGAEETGTEAAALSPVDFTYPWEPTIAGHHGEYLYYRNLDYGSHTLIHPLRLIENGGFGILQIENRDNRPGKIMYGRGIRTLLKNLGNPGWSIHRNGFWDFFSREAIPVSINSGKAQYWPNYMNHLFGGGMSYRMMEEYYRYHGWKHTKWAAGTTIFFYHFLNEVVEINENDGPSMDPIADFYIFNPAGVILFSSDKIARFFSETLHMTDWSYQPVYMPKSRELQNHGQNYAVKYHLNDHGSTSLFYHWGSHAELGLSFTNAEGHCLSAGLGLVAKNLKEVGEISKTLDLATSGGIFYDRHNSLLASLLFARTKDFRYRLNLYPGLIKLGPLKPGFFFALDYEHTLMSGITLASLRHLPFGIGQRF